MRETDDKPHPKAAERRRVALRNFVGSTAMGVAGLYMMVGTEHVLYGLVAAVIGFGIATFSDVKELL